MNMNQRHYISKILERFEMTNSKPRATPSEQKLNFGCKIPFDPRGYRDVVGSLIYAMTCTMPDICWIVPRLSQFLSNTRFTPTKHV